MSQGYVRVHPDNRPDAVIWWYVRTYDDGFVFARGGSVRKARNARREIRQASTQAIIEHNRYIERPNYRLLPDGSLEPIDYGWLDLDGEAMQRLRSFK